MPTPPIGDDELLRVRELVMEAVAVGCVPVGGHHGVGKRGVVSFVAERLGVMPQAAKLRVHRAMARFPIDGMSIGRMSALKGEVGGPPIPPIAVPPDGFEISRNNGAYDSDGNLLRQWVGSKPAPGDEYAIPAGHVIKGESALVDPTGRVLAKWIKTREGAGEGLIEGLREAFAAYDGAAEPIAVPTIADEDLLTIYPIPDLHFGALAWGEETGDDYDVKIASMVATRSIASLVEQSRPSSHAVLVFLGDYFHANDEKGVTPGSGHRLDTDGRWQKVFTAGAHLATTLVDIIARKHKTVTVRCLKGNHDTDSAVCLAVALALFYSKSDRITIDDDPGIAWFLRFGDCLLGATHGHSMKPEAMAMMMAVDRSEDWGVTRFKQMWFGHVHHETSKEVAGVRIESLQSPAARDAWNAEHGYRAGRSLSAITFHKDHGEIGRHRVNITGSRPRIRVPARAA